jgi:integrase
MPQRRSTAVTITAINAMAPGDIIHDTTIKGFGARRQKDAVSYFFKTRVNGKQRWYTIGRHGNPWVPETARKYALKILNDPDVADKKPVVDTTRTFTMVADEYLATHGAKLKPGTLAVQQRMNRLFLTPAFGKLQLIKITRTDVEMAHAAWGKGTPRSANHALAVLSSLMNWAEERGYRPEDSNPCRRVKHFKQNSRERFLTPDELACLGAALTQAEAEHLVGPYAVAALRLLILTGARHTEILTLKWTYIDIERAMIFLPDSKTGKKPITLNRAALDVLNTIPRFAHNPYVIVGQQGEHLVNLQKPWQLIRKLAGLDTLRIHDLRHTYASVAVASGGSLPILGRQLGHSQPQTTQRYAHLADDSVRQMNQTTGEILANALKRKPV